MRVTRGVRRILTEDAEQAAHLGQGVSCRLADGLEVRAALLRKALGREARALGLHGDRRDVVRDDVVQVARNASALLHRCPVLKRVDHRFPCLVPFGERLTALATRITERLCRHDDHEQQHAGEPGPSPENGSIA